MVARVVLPALLLATVTTAVSAQTTAPPRTISVSGNAEVRVAPNEAILSIGVETDSKEIAVARSENDRRVKAITDAARGQGIAYSGWWSPYSSWWGPRYGGGAAQNVVQESGGRGAGADDALVPGQISVTASVNVTFEVAPRR